MLLLKSGVFFFLSLLKNSLAPHLSLLALALLIPFPPPSTSASPEVVQLRAYIQAGHLPSQVLQVELSSHRSFSQYTPDLQSEFGFDSCGLIASTQWMLATPRNPVYPSHNIVILEKWMRLLRKQAVDPQGYSTYYSSTGIQPSDLVQAVRASGMDAAGRDRWSLSGIYQALIDGQIVVVDLRVQAGIEIPSTTPQAYAHFARVLGMDARRELIYIENTLGQQDGKPYWAISLESFLDTWQYPESLATGKTDQSASSIHKKEDVTQWAMVISP